MTTFEIATNQALPERTHKPTNVSLFLYNAAVWNPHRIHYDEAYTKAFEGHSKLLIDGPLMGDWMAQCVSNWLNEHGKIYEFQYKNKQAAYLGDIFRSGGKVLSCIEKQRKFELELWVTDTDKNRVATGSAKIEIKSP